MSRFPTPHQFWSQVPVELRLVSLTAGSYSVRASSSQRGTVVFGTGGLTVDLSISSVTTSRAHGSFGGWTPSSTGDAGRVANAAYGRITAATTVGFARADGQASSGNIVGTNAEEVMELF